MTQGRRNVVDKRREASSICKLEVKFNFLLVLPDSMKNVNMTQGPIIYKIK
jgi:hypothetical protein